MYQEKKQDQCKKHFIWDNELFTDNMDEKENG